QYLQPPLLLRNTGGRFTRVTQPAGEVLTKPWAGRGVALGDLDNDGDVDIVVATCGDRPHVLRNDGGNAGHWLSLSTAGSRSNRDGAGAAITVVGASGLTQHFGVTTGSSYLSASDKRVLVGLGRDRTARSITVKRPSVAVQTLRDVT